MQIDKLFSAIWHNTTTGPGTPLTGLSATITIRDKSTNTVVVDNEAMTEVGLGEYDYTFNAMVSTKAYSYVMNPNSTLAYIVSGFVDPRMANMDGAITDIRGSGGGFSINYQTINSHTTKKINEIKEQIQNLPNFDEKLNEIDSHNNLAKIEILDRIEESETEICSDIIRSKKEIKEDNVSTRQLVRQKTEKLDKNISKLSDRQDQTDKMIEEQAEEIEEELEQIYKQEADNIENELEDQYKKEAQDIEDEIKKEINS